MSRVSSVRREVIAKIHRLGIAETLRLGTAKIFREIFKRDGGQSNEVHPFDLKYGTDTSKVVEVGALDMADERMEHAVRYQTARVDVYEALLNELNIPFEEYVFIDLGSGKGRAMLLASRLPFKAIRGVELSQQLHRIACQNISIYRESAQRCHDIQSLCEDATCFEFPPEKIVLYMFNPFDEEMMRLVVRNLEKSLRKHQKPIYVLYLKALHRRLFDESELFCEFKVTDKYVIFQSKETEKMSQGIA
jgi:hypothetical protein